jgi:hypothetical protein
MVWLRACASLIAVHIALVPALRCQQSGDCQSTNLIVGVRDVRGSFIPGLDTAAFRAELSHHAVKISSSSRQHSSPRLIVLIDVSGSMSHPGKWKIASAVANELVSDAPADAQIGFAMFADDVREAVPFTSERGIVIEKVRQLPSLAQAERKGKSAIRDSIARTVDLFQKPEPGDAIYVITDGEDNASRTDLKKTRGILTARGVRLFVFLMRSKLLDADDRVHVNDFEGLAPQVGGMVIRYEAQDGFPEEWYDGARSQELLTSSTKIIDQEIWNYYLLRMQLPSTFSKEQKWNLELLDRNGRKRKDAELAYPREFLPCAVP